MGQGLRLQTLGVATVDLSPGSLFVVLFYRLTPSWTAIHRMFLASFQTPLSDEPDVLPVLY